MGPTTTLCASRTTGILLLIDAGGKDIQYLMVGEGEGAPVVLLHGFGGDINIWVFNQETLAEVGHTVYALDLPGHGASTKDVGKR